MSEARTSPQAPLKVLFDSLIALDGREEREAFLDFTCREDPELRARLERLLALHTQADDFFNGAKSGAEEVPEEVTGEEAEGTRIGRYRLLGRLGEGGCGVVYLAEQQEPVKRRVALKIIRLGMDTENVIARFEMERQALAMMDHPNIARVLDVGATRTGRPYFVMQLVDGEKITDFCDQKRLGLAERLRLFIRICQAVQHAHQKGVIHRDIKPSNILIWEHDGEAVPKVIDFGIAKATESSLEGHVTYTAEGHFIGTPSYMSPEQAAGRGLDVDTRTDVYSLGSLLHELLCGRPPFDPAALREMGADEVQRTLLDVDPPKPSSVIESMDPAELAEVAARRACEVSRLAAAVRDDLDRIVCKAMAKDRQQRYSGADALAADVSCFLNDEPVSARPPGGLYRLRKLVRRNKVVFGTGAVVFASLVLGLGGATAMYFRANRAREAAEQARANEAELRQKAEVGRNIARAAVLVRHGRFDEADGLMGWIPPSQAEPSLESADTFRALGIWHGREGRWRKAADRFAGLAYSLSSADTTDTDAVSLNLQPAATAFCEAGDVEGYQRLRSMAVERFGQTTHPVVAEQVVKACLLRAADDEVLSRLARLEDLMLDAEKATGGVTGDNLVAWREFAIALMEFRKGNYNEALQWLTRCMASTSENPARTAIALAVRSMVFGHQNRRIEAAHDMERAESIVAQRFAREPSIFDEWEPVWQDWINARLLIREAEAAVGK
ncbi:serine/threonine protein kinase [Haloferula sargassicola]|uniref:Serine/threonine-protein kinase PknD n=1 Tax=Haloferula sargassicola TaxID=490096 RepID=A0ABP9UPC2_9BACT